MGQSEDGAINESEFLQYAMRILTSLQSLFRLVQGAARFGLGVNPECLNHPMQLFSSPGIVVSVDLFDTLIIRPPQLEKCLRLAVSRCIATLPFASAYTPVHIMKILEITEADLRKSMRHAGFDPEITRRLVYQQAFLKLGSVIDIGEMVNDLVEWELEQLLPSISLNPVMVGFIEAANAAGVKVIAVSDMYFSAQELMGLLKKLDAPSLAKIYVSCDVGFSKFRGGLFDHVLKMEGVRPDEIVHIGDNRWSDIYSARQKGIRSLYFRPVKFRDVRHARQSGKGKEYCLGYRTLGPVIASFAHLLLLKSDRMGIKHLAFVARDGDLLKQAVACLASHAAFLPQPSLHYLYLSRRSTALPSVSRLDKSELANVAYIRSGGSLLRQLIDYFGLSADSLSSCLSRHGLNLSDDPIKQEAIWPLLDDPYFQRHVDVERTRQHNLLHAYLKQQMDFADKVVALVDIGWRGSIQNSLNQAFDDFSLKGLYFGYWSESEVVNPARGDSQGIITDIQRGRRLFEGSAWYAAFILEAICREDCETVVGYQQRGDGTVYPVFADAPSRHGEATSGQSCGPIRQGILDYIEDYAKYGCSALLDEKKARRKAQYRLLRLAFFPTLSEIEILGGLQHTEGHAMAWRHPLIAQDRPNPILAPRRWLAGLSSPWRFGYVAATGGYLMAALFMVLEAGLLACPPSFRDTLRNVVLGLARPRRGIRQQLV